MALLRYQLFLAYVAVFLAVWYYALKSLSNGWDRSESDSKIIVAAARYAPLMALAAFGIYALALLVIGVARFSDRPDAAAELDRDIKEAKHKLAKRGLQ